MQAPNDDLVALREQGYSFPQIGAILGIDSETARGRYRRRVNAARRVAGLAAGLGAPALDAPSGRVGRAGRGGPGGESLRPVVSRSDRPRDLPRPESPPRYIGFDIGYFDLEASGLNGSFGRLFTGACAHVDGSVWAVRCDETRCPKHPQWNSDDYGLTLAIRDHLLSHDILVSWNGKRGWNSKSRSGFDVPMLNARLMVPDHDESPVTIGRYVKHIDLLKEIRKYIELHSFRLAAVQEFLELEEEKNSILPRLWGRALDGDREALDYIADHNRRDVLVLRLTFEKMRKAGLLERPTW